MSRNGGKFMIGLSSYDRQYIVPNGYSGGIWTLSPTSDRAFDPSATRGIPTLIGPSLNKTLIHCYFDAAAGVSVYRFSWDSTNTIDVVETTPLGVREMIRAVENVALSDSAYIGSCLWQYQDTWSAYTKRDEGLIADDGVYPAPRVSFEIVEVSQTTAALRVQLHNASATERVLGTHAGAGVHLRLDSVQTFVSADPGSFHAVEGWDSLANAIPVSGSHIIELRRSFFEDLQDQSAASGLIRIAADGDFELSWRAWMYDKDSSYSHNSVSEPYIARVPADVPFHDPDRFLTYAVSKLDVRQTGPPPRVVSIYQDNGAVRGGASNVNPDGPASIEARTKGITRCSIQFSENVNIGPEDVEIRDVNDTRNEAGPSTFTYDPSTFTLTMTWPDGTFVDRWVRIHVLDCVTSATSGAPLDGEIFRTSGDPSSGLALDGSLPSGDGVAGGSAMFVLGSLIADVTGNRVVNVTDRGIVQQNIGKTCPEGDLPSDITGNCVVNATDRGWVQQKIGGTLPTLPVPATIDTGCTTAGFEPTGDGREARSLDRPVPKDSNTRGVGKNRGGLR
jgi:hypothetical protein